MKHLYDTGPENPDYQFLSKLLERYSSRSTVRYDKARTIREILLWQQRSIQNAFEQATEPHIPHSGKGNYGRRKGNNSET